VSDEQVTRHRRSLEVADNPVFYILRLYVQFLQGLFNFNPSGCFHWEPDAETTEILIRAEAPLDMEVVGRRPAITVVMGPIQFQGLAIDQMVEMGLSSEERRRSDLLSSHLVVYCLSESDVVSQQLAHLVIHGTRVNQRLLESPGGFHTIMRPSPSLNPPSPPGALVTGDPQGLVMVQINIPFSFQWTWIQSPTAPAGERSLDMITSKRRASDYPYSSLSRLEKVQLAMSTAPVLVRRLTRGNSIQIFTVTDEQDPFQTVEATKSVAELLREQD
jgi:hypothetical protein